MLRLHRARTLLGLLLLVPLTALADFDALPFELRLFLAVDRQSNYSSTLARQASIAALEGASANPGAAAWREPAQPTTTVTASFVDAPATGGRSVIAAPVSLRWQAAGHGTVALAYAYTETRNPLGNNGLAEALRSDEWIASYGRRIGLHQSVGFTVRLTNGTIVSDSLAPELGGQPVRNSTHFLSPDVNVGYATDLGAPLTVGVSAGYGRTRAHTSVTNLAPLFIPIPQVGTGIVLPPGSLLAEPDDTISTYALRAGIGVHPDASTAVYFDAIGLRIAAQHAGSQNLARFAVGADWAAGNGWLLRAGVGVDTIGQVNWSAGFGYRAGPSFEAQFGLQTNAAPEVNREIGRTRLLAGSLAWIF